MIFLIRNRNYKTKIMKYLKVLYLTLCCYSANAQLSIGPSTSWRSDPGTYVVMDNLGIQYNATTTSFPNIFKFTGNSDVHISKVYYTGSLKSIWQKQVQLKLYCKEV